MGRTYLENGSMGVVLFQNVQQKRRMCLEQLTTTGPNVRVLEKKKHLDRRFHNSL